MKNDMRTLTLLLCLLIPVAIAQDSQTLEVQARYAECNALEKGSKIYEFQQVLVDNDFGPWQKADPKADAVYGFMRVHALGARVRSLMVNQGTPSGDWDSVTSYCFRADGSLAFRFQNLHTFYNDSGHAVEAQIRMYFSPNGKSFKTLETTIDLETKKTIKTDYMGMAPPDFLNSSAVIKEVGSSLLPLK